MIQIRRANLDKLAEEHFLCLQGVILKRLKKSENNLIVSFIKENLKTILTGTPQFLKENIISKINYSSVYKKDLEKIFDYKSFTRYTKQRYNAYTLAKKLNINVCPYCNRQYTFLQEAKTRPEFDHFYSQEQYPYLALSFFNLIPSCHVCNTHFKRNIKFDIDTHINPYIEGFDDDVKFTLRLITKDCLGLFYGDENSFEIDLGRKSINLSEKKWAKIEQNVKIFYLNELYQQHKDYVTEIMKKSVVYSEDYLESLFNQFGGTLFRNFGEVHRMAFSNYTNSEDLDKRVLSKLSKDISEELGML